ncbi:MAG: cupin domain-containing protein [Ignavibacteria bacterium]|nr:cupin domain-containing protein [Ignavibacteria bacterium]
MKEIILRINGGNIFENLPENNNDEIFERLLTNENFIIERIVSDGHKSPEDFWYDQPTDEFVILLKGSAQIEFEEGESIILKPGDYILIPARKKHRVEWTDLNEKTFWMAVHY